MYILETDIAGKKLSKHKRILQWFCVQQDQLNAKSTNYEEPNAC